MTCARLLRGAVAIPALALAMTLVQAPVTARPAAAQSSQFAPAIYVNGQPVTNFEIQQRTRFLELLGQPGDLAAEARKGLIEDRLASAAGKQLGLKLNPAAIQRGMTEFAARANMSAEDFTRALGESGVSAETFRDFVTAQITWRELVRGKFMPNVSITEVDIDRALAAQHQSANVRVLLSELVIPVQDNPDQAMAMARQLQSEVRSEAAFAEAARNYSAAQTAPSGGKLDWMPLANLPAPLRAEVLGLRPGGVTAPLAVPNAVILLQLRAVSDEAGSAPADQNVQYAQFLFADGPDAAAEAARIRARVDTCNDLLAYAKGLPADQMLLDTRPLNEVPKDIALELAKLDPGESSTALKRGNARVFLMLCARNPVEKGDAARDQMRQQLIGQRLGAMAEVYMEQLRSEAIIRTP